MRIEHWHYAVTKLSPDLRHASWDAQTRAKVTIEFDDGRDLVLYIWHGEGGRREFSTLEDISAHASSLTDS